MVTDPSSPFVTELHRVFESAADVYDQSGVEFFRPIGRRLVSFAGVAAGDSVLDLACGRGAVLLPAAEAVGAEGRAVGVDVSESMLGHAARTAEQQGLRQVETLLMDARRPSLAAGEFDFVLSSCGAFLWISGADDLRPYRELLRPGGRLALSASSLFNLGHGQPSFMPAQVFDLLGPELDRMGELVKDDPQANNPFARPGEAWMGNPDRIRSSLVDAGFTAVDIREENLAMVMDSGEQWVRWTRSNGIRAMWEQIEEPRASELASEVAARIDTLRGPDGRITFDTPIVYVGAEVSRS